MSEKGINIEKGGSYYEPEVSQTFRNISFIGKAVKGYGFILGLEKMGESFGGLGLNQGEKEGLAVVVVSGLALIANMAVDGMTNTRIIRGRKDT